MPDEQRDAIDHERLQSLINSMADGVIALDSDLHVVRYNGAALDVLDTNDTVNGRNIEEFFKPVDKHNQPVDIRELILDSNTPQTFRDYLLPYSDGSKINLYVSIAPVRLGYGKGDEKDGGYVLLLRDITREKSLEEERDEFVSVVSHELRTPITIAEGGISNALLLAHKTGDMTKVVKALTEAHDHVLFLADMINDLATLSRAERGKLQTEIEQFNIAELLNELHDAYKQEAGKKGLALELELDPGLELLSSGKLYVHEILQNFITNAVKYTEKGSVRVTAKQLPEGVRVEVHDTGIGISKTEREKIFDKFFRSEDYRTRQHSGTGLGLYVTFKLARMVKAEIDVESELNVGSTFTIIFPNLA